MKLWQHPDPLLQPPANSGVLLQAYGPYTSTATYSGMTAPLYTPPSR
ncbi:MAG TPA: hypothetical protein VK066_30180 [Chloroflexota bacterium]|nr:hypothetical protein [Chloroflexota bacterium]